jgi:ABC-type molybdate transport system substrate-binding protein
VTRARSARGVAALIAAVAWLGSASAQSAPIRALSSNGVRAALEVLAPQCERSVGRTVTIEYGTSASIRQRIAGGEAVDVAFVTTEVVAELAKGSHVAAAAFASSGCSSGSVSPRR